MQDRVRSEAANHGRRPGARDVEGFHADDRRQWFAARVAQIVDHDNLQRFRNQAADRMNPDEPGAAGNQHATRRAAHPVSA